GGTSEGNSGFIVDKHLCKHPIRCRRFLSTSLQKANGRDKRRKRRNGGLLQFRDAGEGGVAFFNHLHKIRTSFLRASFDEFIPCFINLCAPSVRLHPSCGGPLLAFS